MSEKHEPIIRTCNFCGKGMTGVRPVPKSIVLQRGTYFRPENALHQSCGGSTTFRLEIALIVDGESGRTDSDMCFECERELTTVAVRKIMLHDVIEDRVREKIAEAENRMKDEARQIARLHMEANFGPMLDAHMAHRRNRKKGGG